MRPYYIVQDRAGNILPHSARNTVRHLLLSGAAKIIDEGDHGRFVVRLTGPTPEHLLAKHSGGSQVGVQQIPGNRLKTGDSGTCAQGVTSLGCFPPNRGPLVSLPALCSVFYGFHELGRNWWLTSAQWRRNTMRPAWQSNLVPSPLPISSRFLFYKYSNLTRGCHRTNAAPLVRG